MGIAQNLEGAWKKIEESDRPNAEFIMSTRVNADRLIPSIDSAAHVS